MKYIIDTDSSGQVVPGSATPYQAAQAQDAAPSVHWQPYVWTGGIVLAALILFFMALFKVRQQTIGVVERFGKFKKIVRSGLNFKLPFVDKLAGTLDLRIQQLNVEVETKTKDNVFVSLPISVQYFVIPDKAEDAFYKLDNPTAQITSYVFDSVRGQVPTMTLDEVFENKEKIATAVKTELLETMQNYGYSIVTALVTDISPAEAVKNAMNAINANQRLNEAAKYKGEADKIIQVKAAEAEAESKALQGKGIANQRRAIIDGLNSSVEDMAKNLGVDSKEVLSLILLTQYFDTLKEMGAQKVILFPHSPAGMTDIRQQITEAISAGKEV